MASVGTVTLRKVAIGGQLGLQDRAFTSDLETLVSKPLYAHSAAGNWGIPLRPTLESSAYRI